MSSSLLLLMLLALKVRSRGYKSLMERVNGCQELSRFLVVCLHVLIGSGFDGLESESMLCVAMS